AFRYKDLQQRINQRRLADARAAGDDQNVGDQRRAQGLLLAIGEHQPGARLHPRDRSVGVNRRPGRSSARQRLELLGDLPFGPIESGEEYAAALLETIGDNRAVLKFESKGGLDKIRWNLEQLLREGNKFVGRQGAMPAVHRFGEREGDAGADTNEGGLLDPKFGRYLVGRQESGAADITGQAI